MIVLLLFGDFYFITTMLFLQEKGYQISSSIKNQAYLTENYEQLTVAQYASFGAIRLHSSKFADETMTLAILSAAVSVASSLK